MSSTVFGTEMVVLTFILCIVEIPILFVHLGVLISDPLNKGNWRFLILILLFLIYNFCSGLLPDKNIELSLLIQNVLAFGSGIVLATYYFFFLVKELEIDENKIFNVKFLLFSLAGSFIVGYVFTYLLSGSFFLSKRIFIGIPVFIALYFCYRTVVVLVQKRGKSTDKSLPYRGLFLAGYTGISFMTTMPIVVVFGDFQALNIGLVNVSFFLILITYYRLIFYQGKLKQELLLSTTRRKNRNLYADFNLTPKQIQVAKFLVEDGLNFKQISEELCISQKTVSKHASDIYKKVKLSGIKELLKEFSSD